MMEAMAPPETAPALSTPDTRLLEDDPSLRDAPKNAVESEEKLDFIYEIQETVRQIREARWKRIALQFPDGMLKDAPRVARALQRGLRSLAPSSSPGHSGQPKPNGTPLEVAAPETAEKIFVLADTSYGSCCVDEVAAEHADADAVVHYGRACLSPTSRLPVIHCFAKSTLDLGLVVSAFQKLYRDLSQKIILMADSPYQHHLCELRERLNAQGYTNIFDTTVVRCVSSPLPNRSIPLSVDAGETALSDWALFHVSEPSSSLLLNISASVKSVHFYPTEPQAATREAVEASTARLLRRRYATTARLSTVPVFGILINTLSVRNYTQILQRVKKTIADAGKKSYTFVVGKVNAAKIANFSEIGGWVVIGCWESSLFESTDFWKPLITPFELELALQSDASRVWTGKWTSDFQAVLASEPPAGPPPESGPRSAEDATAVADAPAGDNDNDEDEEESEPPEFDLRTGRYVSHSRPMGARAAGAQRGQTGADLTAGAESTSTTTLARRPKGTVATIGGEYSPAADFFRNKRSWQGLGSDFDAAYDSAGAQLPTEGASIAQGRHGIARGYTVGTGSDPSPGDDSTQKH